MNHEELLRSTLQAKATEASDTLTFDAVRRGAERSRRRTRLRTTALVAATVLVAVGIPTAVLLQPTADAPSPAPSPTPTTSGSPSPAPSGSPSPTPTHSDLATVRRGPDIAIPWMSNGVIHRPGARDVALPGGSWDDFTNYHGGWLLSGGGGVVQLGGDGHATQLAQTGGRIAVSGDLMQTAFYADGKVRVGITTGMGEGEQSIPVRSPDETGPVGFLSRGRLVYNGLKGQILLLDPSDGSSSLGGLARASASTVNGDLIAGTTVDNDGTAAVVSASGGKTLWTKPGWFTGQFSRDGRYLAAYQAATGGEFETVAILDARTGDVVTRSDAPGLHALPELAGPDMATGTAWDEGGSLLIPYRDGQTWAILRLTVHGTLTRATDVFAGTPFDDNLLFAARP